MGATNGITPLDADNVIHKLSQDYKEKKFTILGIGSDQGLELTDSNLIILKTLYNRPDKIFGSGISIKVPVVMRAWGVYNGSLYQYPEYIYYVINYGGYFNNAPTSGTITRYESANVNISSVMIQFYDDYYYPELARRACMIYIPVLTKYSSTPISTYWHGYVTIQG